MKPRTSRRGTSLPTAYYRLRSSLCVLLWLIHIHSKRAFQSQFNQKWRFPSKQNTAWSNEDLVTRVGELWEKNTSQKDMIQILGQEGYTLTDRSLSKIRKANNWTLRSSNGMKPRTASSERSQEDAFEVPEISPEIIAKRNQQFEKLQADSAERLKNRTRRVRTIGWAGLGPDPPMDPRFPSEMTLSQSKEQLSLNKDDYNFMRSSFQTLCEMEGVIKKTLAGAGKWQALKDRLIAQCPFLQAVLYVDGADDKTNEGMKKRQMALDIICSDVTKRIRTARNRVTIPDAKSVMGINPTQGSEIRKQFYQILLADHFTSKIEAGPGHWNELKQKLIDGSSVLREVLYSHGSASDETAKNQKMKALEVLCRDVMKRLRDDQTRKAKMLRANSGPASDDQSAHNRLSLENEPGMGEISFAESLINNGHIVDTGLGTLTSQTQSAPTTSNMLPQAHINYGMDIDPSLMEISGSHPALTFNPHHPLEGSRPPEPPDNGPGLSAWFRISDTSPERLQTRVWMGRITDALTVNAIHAVAHSRFANAGVQIVKIEAHTRFLNSMTIDRDDELAVFLQNVNGETPTFTFHFAPATSSAV